MSKLLNVTYEATIEEAAAQIIDHLKAQYIISKRAIALLLLQEDEDIKALVREKEKNGFIRISEIVAETKSQYDKPMQYVISLMRQQIVNTVTNSVVTVTAERNTNSWAEKISTFTMNPLTGIPILLLVLYFGLYKFVGEIGAGVIVDFFDEEIFGEYINPWINEVVDTYVPWPWLQELIARDYGIVTLGVRYATAIVLPLVGTFFLTFSVIEDSGYLPRLAMLVDRVFKMVGLNGRAVIPMTLGFGCDTMATMVSRTLETRRERIIATLLLSLAIPCSAQLGVIMGLLSGMPEAMLAWVGFVGFIFLLIGFLTAQIMPGVKPTFYMEVPPLRLPRLTNVLTKTYTRMQWYFVEILPLFLFASVLIWAGNLTGIFMQVIDAMSPIMNLLGLPKEAAQAFLFGFFRRDYGAAGLYDLQQSGLLSPQQLVVTAATLTLFVPCIAQFSMMIKERGIKTALAIAGFIFPFAFLAGAAINWLLTITGVLR